MKYILALACLGLLAVPTFAGTYSTTVLADSPVAYWNFDDGTATNLSSVGSALNGTAYNSNVLLTGSGIDGTGFGTPNGSTYFQVGLVDPAEYEEYLQVLDPGTGSVLDFGMGDAMSIEVWFNPERDFVGSTDQYLIGKGRVASTSATDQNYAVRLNPDTGVLSVLARSYDDTAWLKWSGTLSGTSMEMLYGNWHHLVFTHTWGNSTSTAIYYDNTDITSIGSWNELSPGFSAGNMYPLESDEPLWLGSTRGAETWTRNSFAGELDEVAIYDIQLTATQIDTHYNAAGYTSAAPYAPPAFINGDFEAAQFDEGWRGYDGDNPLTLHTGLNATGLAPGTQAAYVTDTITGSVMQTILSEELDSQWQAGFLFAAEAPESSRTLNIGFNNVDDDSTSDNYGIWLRIDAAGSLQAYDKAGSAWQTLGTEGLIDFSIDADADGSLDDEGDTLNVYSIRIEGDYTTTPNYDVYLSEANTGVESLIAEDVSWFYYVPEAGSSPEAIIIRQTQSGSAGSSFIVDEIYFGEQEPEPLAGDANSDGQVDGSDVTILANNWQYGVTGTADATWDMGDFNGDGMVDGSDVTILANNWQAGVTTAAATVPEPGMLVMLLAGVGMLSYLRRR